MELSIEKEWNGKEINHSPVKIILKKCHSGISLNVRAPYFNDPPPIRQSKTEPCPNLWDFEVVEVFFLNEKNQYLEVELSPHGFYLVLQLEGSRNMLQEQLTLKYKSDIDEDKRTWTGEAEIPSSYLPLNITKINCYSIHGLGDKRTYEALSPTPPGKFTQPDFHRLEYFKEVNSSIFSGIGTDDKWGETPSVE